MFHAIFPFKVNFIVVVVLESRWLKIFEMQFRSLSLLFCMRCNDGMRWYTMESNWLFHLIWIPILLSFQMFLYLAMHEQKSTWKIHLIIFRFTYSCVSTSNAISWVCDFSTRLVLACITENHTKLSDFQWCIYCSMACISIES